MNFRANEVSSQPHRTLDDEELDSGDDENRYDRMDETMDGAADSRVDYKTLTVQDVDLSRAPALTTHNGEVRNENIPMNCLGGICLS